MTTQLIHATARNENKGLIIGNQYLFSFQIAQDGIIRIITTDDIEIYYANIHEFLLSWDKVSSLGFANDEATFVKMLEDLKAGK